LPQVGPEAVQLLRRSAPTNEESAIAGDILAYLSAHPNAQDTLQGITEWWLLEQEIKSRIDQVERVLERLVAKGLLIKRTGKDNQTRYQINSGKSLEIDSLLSARRRAARSTRRSSQANIKRH
jgi:hypothetical protein